jgi:hypothetical protein
MTLRPLTWILAIALLAGTIAPVRGQESPELPATIKGLKCEKQGAAVKVAYRIDGALGPELRSSLDSGIAVTFVHKLSVVKRRALFFDKTLARLTLEVTVSMDTLTGQYTLTRKVGDHPAQTTTTERKQTMEAFLTEVNDVVIPLPDKPEKGVIELHVKAEYERDYYVLWVLPWSLSALDDKECR